MKNNNFINFLNDMKQYDEDGIIESITSAYNIIYESSEDVVNSIKSQLGSEDKNPLEQDDINEQDELDTESNIEEPQPDIPLDTSI